MTIPFGTQDRLLPLAELRYVNGAIEFAQENQHSWVARCPLGQPDPPVYSNPMGISAAATPEFVVVCESLNHFLITLCLQEAVMSCANLAIATLYSAPAASLNPLHHNYYTPGIDTLIIRSVQVLSPLN
jgi:hypothetical protein